MLVAVTKENHMRLNQSKIHFYIGITHLTLLVSLFVSSNAYCQQRQWQCQNNAAMTGDEAAQALAFVPRCQTQNFADLFQAIEAEHLVDTRLNIVSSSTYAFDFIKFSRGLNGQPQVTIEWAPESAGIESLSHSKPIAFSSLGTQVGSVEEDFGIGDKVEYFKYCGKFLHDKKTIEKVYVCPGSAPNVFELVHVKNVFISKTFGSDTLSRHDVWVDRVSLENPSKLTSEFVEYR